MAKQVPTLSNTIDLGTALHDEEVAERLRRREERNRARLALLNQNAGREGDASVPVARTPLEPPAAALVSRPIERELAPAAPDRLETNAAAVESAEAPPRPPTAVGMPAPAPAASRPRETRRPPSPSPAALARDEAAAVETLPTERFLKVRNAIVDRLPRFVKGNRYLVYQHIYRNTLGRRQAEPEAFFVSRLVAEQLRLSEKTVRTCWQYLERVGLIATSSTQGSHHGMRIRVLDLEIALTRLETSAVTLTADHRQELPPNEPISGNSNRSRAEEVTAEHRASAVTLTAPCHERHEDMSNTMHGVGMFDELVERLTDRYAFAPERARAELTLIAVDDLALVPRLLDRLDAEIARSRVANPAGLLVTWLRAFPTWRPLLEQADRTTPTVETEEARGDLLAYLEETDARARETLRRMDGAEFERLRTTVRAKAEARSPSVAKWTEAQWTAHLEPLIIAELRDRFETFDVWLARRSDEESRER